MANTLPSIKGSDSAFFHNFLDFFWGPPCFQGQFPYIHIFSRSAREIRMKIGHELHSTYSLVFQSSFRPSLTFHFFWRALVIHDCSRGHQEPAILEHLEPFFFFYKRLFFGKYIKFEDKFFKSNHREL